jgi:stage V sporulation protein G
MKITEVRVYPVLSEGKLKAYASVVFDNDFVVREVKIIEGVDGLFMSMPSRKKRDGAYKDIAHPLNNKMRCELENAVLEAYVIAKRDGFPDLPEYGEFEDHEE